MNYIMPLKVQYRGAGTSSRHQCHHQYYYFITIDNSSKTQSKMFRQTIRTAQIARTRVGLGTTMPQLRFNSTSAVAEVKDLAQFNKLIGNKEKVSIVDFYATWCGPCKAIAPIFDTLAQKIPEAEFARVDVDRAEDVAREYGITAMPTILFFKGGEKVSTIVGANMPQLIKSIQEYSGVDVKLR